MDQRQSVRRRSNIALRAVATLEYGLRPTWLLLALTDRSQQPRDVSHHMLQKRIGRDRDRQPVTVAAYLQGAYLPIRRRRPAAGRPESRKVVFAEQMFCCLEHSLLIQRFTNPPGTIALQRRTHERFRIR